MKKLELALLIFFSLLNFSLTAQDYSIENNEVKVAAPIKFKAGSAELLLESDAALQIIKKYLEDKSYVSLLRVESHSDKTGDEKTNQLLTEKRSAAICQKLISLGVDCMRLLPVGFGSDKPVADNGKSKGREKNGRIGFVIAALKGKAIGGMPLDGGGRVPGNPCH